MVNWHTKHIGTQWGVAIVGFLLVSVVLLIPVLHQNQDARSHASPLNDPANPAKISLEPFTYPPGNAVNVYARGNFKVMFDSGRYTVQVVTFRIHFNPTVFQGATFIAGSNLHILKKDIDQVNGLVSVSVGSTTAKTDITSKRSLGTLSLIAINSSSNSPVSFDRVSATAVGGVTVSPQTVTDYLSAFGSTACSAKLKGKCLNIHSSSSLCQAKGGRYNPGNYCPGDQSVQCCVPPKGTTALPELKPIIH